MAKAHLRKSPGPARRSNPDNAHRKKVRDLHKFLEVPKGKLPKLVRVS